MDKLRALHYFATAAEEGSFSSAARRFEVSTTAVAKLVTALERSLGASLFHRSPQGLALTAEGARYLESCHPALQQLHEADEAVAAGDRPRGLLTVGAPAFVLQNCLGPSLPRFHASYPDIELDLRIANRVADADAAIDVFVLFGWQEPPAFVRKVIGQTRYVVVGSPAYWSARGLPQRPEDLEGHPCFALRNPLGTLLDLWEFGRGGEVRSVKVRGWLASDHRNLLLDAALAGEGVLRVTDLLAHDLLRIGRLAPALTDWVGLHPPPVTIHFLPKHRRAPRVRAFVEFATEVFRKLGETARGGGVAAAAQRPEWYGKHYGRASSAMRR